MQGTSSDVVLYSETIHRVESQMTQEGFAGVAFEHTCRVRLPWKRTTHRWRQHTLQCGLWSSSKHIARHRPSDTARGTGLGGCLQAESWYLTPRTDFEK